MYESLIIAPPMFCCGYRKQPILVVLNRNTNRSEVFREPTAVAANLAAIWPTRTADVLYRPFPSGRATGRRQGPVVTLARRGRSGQDEARSPSALDFPCTKIRRRLARRSNTRNRPGSGR